jgi:trigger factor
LRAEARKEAIEAIKSWTTLNEIAEAEGIEVTDEDFQKEAAELSQRTGASLETVASFLGEEEHRNRYERRILHAKVTQAVMGLVAITDKEVSREELEHADEQPAEGGASCQELEHADEQLAEGGASCQELEHADEQPAQGEAS